MSTIDSLNVVLSADTQQFERQLTKAIECVDKHLQNERVKPPKGLQLFAPADEEK